MQINGENMKKLKIFRILTAFLVFSTVLSVFAVGIVAATDFEIAVKEDTYVVNNNGSGDTSNQSFGAEADMQLKSNNGALTRYSFVKFDISGLTDTGFTCIDLKLFNTFRGKSFLFHYIGHYRWVD